MSKSQVVDPSGSRRAPSPTPRLGARTIVSGHLRVWLAGAAIVSALVCLSCTVSPEQVYVELHCLIFNTTVEEILVISPDYEVSIIGFFLQPGEGYHYQYLGVLEKDAGRDEFRLPFEFYGPGPDSSYKDFISSYVFTTEVYDGIVYADTFYVQ